MPVATVPSEAEILEKIVAAGGFSPAGARDLLKLSFDRRTMARIRRLLEKNGRGTITAPERLSLEKYLRVGQFIDLVQAQARLSLKGSGKAG